MSNVIDAVEALRGHVARIAAVEGPSDVFRVVLEGARAAAPRSAVYLVRRGVLRGWGGSGYGAEASSRLRETELPVGRSWPAELADPERPPNGRVDPGDGDRGPDFGQPAFDEARGFALRVRGKTLGVVVIERDTDQEPWCPPVVPLLLEAAQLRLETDLARRKLRRLLQERPGEEAAPRENAAPVADAGASDATPEPAATSAGAAPSVEPVPGPAESDHDPERAAARRFARLVATDIRLYNEESVLLGRRQRDLAQRLHEQLDRGRETFERRFPDLGDDGRRILRDAFVQVLAGGDTALLAREEPE